eukprot:1538898-Prymnesium_polylepis.2
MIGRRVRELAAAAMTRQLAAAGLTTEAEPVAAASVIRRRTSGHLHTSKRRSDMWSLCGPFEPECSGRRLHPVPGATREFSSTSRARQLIRTAAGLGLPVRDVAPFGARPGVRTRLAGMIDEDDCRAALSLASGMATSAGKLRADNDELPAHRRRADRAQETRAASGLGSAGRSHLSCAFCGRA